MPWEYSPYLMGVSFNLTRKNQRNGTFTEEIKMRRNSLIAKCIAMITQVTISLVTPILICTYLGIWLDNKFGWNIAVFLIILGFFAGARNAYTLVKQVIRESEKFSDYDR